MAYLAVVLCHELVRYLYPHEPVVGFTHEDPVGFIDEHIQRLTRLAHQGLETISPYSWGDGRAGTETSSVALQTSSLYSDLWKSFDRATLEQEAQKLLRNRIPQEVLARWVVGKSVVDMGCGSGRYTLALAAIGAGSVTGVDYQARSYAGAEALARQLGLRATFTTADVLELPFADEAFDFVFCNGVIHHTVDIIAGLDQMKRVMKRGGAGFLYVYGSGGIYWHTRARLRELFKHIPYSYTEQVFQVMRVPVNRFIFCDTWYVPIERHTTTAELQAWFADRGLTCTKLVSQNLIDLDNAIARGVRDARVMWGEGDHRYFLERPVSERSGS
jgi:ubiquinone/menaquinone biosynthesis C-methylase UbiE